MNNPKKRLLFVINQFFKGGAETALLNLLNLLSPKKYDIDLLIFDQIELPGTITLIPEIPKWVNVVNIAKRESGMAFVKKAWFKLYRKITGRQLFRISAEFYLKDRFYDAAISYGEWFSSALVAKKAHAERKYVWIHADIDKASFLHPDIARFEQYFDRFIFASGNSMRGAIEQYPFLEGRSAVVHNLVDLKTIEALSKAQTSIELPSDQLPILITVANVRAEKNHLRQAEAMKLLFDRGVKFHWINAGALAEIGTVEKLKLAIKRHKLEEYFHLIGAVSNPYPLMKASDAVCVLSDHESWSMVITEAKMLGVPVISTVTSGALEQIADTENGLLCDFSADDIANKIELFLTDSELKASIRRRLESESFGNIDIATLESLVCDERKKMLFVFDDINYVSGARNAALEQIEALSETNLVDVFSGVYCRDSELRKKYKCVGMMQLDAMACLTKTFREVVVSKNFNLKHKLLRLAYAISARLGYESAIPNFIISRKMTPLFEAYDSVIVVSEASKLREFVSKLRGPQKIQWIHTDYSMWSRLNSWTRFVTKNDAKLYRKFDKIVCLNETLRLKFTKIHSHLFDKTVAIPNIIPYKKILAKADAELTIAMDKSRFNIITIGRIDREKRYDRLLDLAVDLRRRDVDFCWYFVGDGPLETEIREKILQYGLSDNICLTGQLGNPLPLLKQCDLMVLMSEYEGTPVTIDEAKVLGIPVLASDVGGIREQLGEWGNVVNFVDAKSVILDLLKHSKNYSYFNVQILNNKTLNKLMAELGG